MLKTVKFRSTESASLATINQKLATTKLLERYFKHIGEINHDADDEWKEIVFSAFNLKMYTISFWNGDKRISTISFDVRYHPDNSIILKTVISRISPNDKTSTYDDHVYFVSYSLIQYSSPECYRHQIIRYNKFYHLLAIIIIYNIDTNIIHC